MDIYEATKKKKSDRIFHGKPVRGTTPLKTSHLSDKTKVRTDIEETKRKLLQLSEQVKGINQVKGFLSLLWEALGIDKSASVKGGSPSRYAAFKCKDGTTRIITVRASAHNSKSSTFTDDGNINGDCNLSIVLQSKRKKNTFQACDSVNMEEYVYVDDRIKNIESPLSLISTSIANYLETGYYHDSTGVAFVHYSPFNPALAQNITIDAYGNAIPSSQKTHGADYIPESKSKNYKNMKKNVQRINESQLRAIVAESVKKVLKEISVDTAIAAHKKAQNDIDNAEFSWDDSAAVDKYSRRQRQADTFAKYAQDNGAQYYPYGLIGWYNDDSDGVFDRSEVIYGDSIDDIPDDGDGIYALTREGKETYEQWREDASVGYDLCYGRMKGIARKIGGRERDIWKYLTSREYLARRIKY